VHSPPSCKITCRTVQVLPECLRLSTAVHCIVAAKGFSYGIQNKLHSPTEWASWIPSTPKKKLTIRVRRLCCSPAPRAVQQRVPLDRASVTRCSAAWSDKRARGKGHRTNEFKDKPTSKKIREGREEVTVSVCVCVYSAILSHLSWLTIGTANQWAEPPPRPLVQSFATALSLHMDVVNLHAPAEGELHLDDGFGAALRGHGLDIAAGYGCPPSPTTTFSWPCFLH